MGLARGATRISSITAAVAGMEDKVIVEARPGIMLAA